MNIAEIGATEKREFLKKLRETSCIETWRIFFWKEKALYTCMNKLVMQMEIYIANVFLPAKSQNLLTSAIIRVTPQPTVVESFEQVVYPTAFETNSYTATSQ
jgi:vacuolar-type H+-ATPase subunit I/STV1